jgi:hypothetical protein
MKSEFTDEQLDKMMRTLVCDASADGEEIKDIASSPSVWWAIQREINARQETSRSPWPPANVIRRWLLIAFPAAAAAGLVLSFVYLRSIQTVEQAVEPAASSMTAFNTPAVTENAPAPLSAANIRDIPAKAASGDKTLSLDLKPSPAVARRPKHQPAIRLTASNVKKNEVKTDFIALTYARNPESGQVVRVKVPSSMMVSLGVVSSVNKPGEMVDAEVVVGDDGLTRAIRFIR